MGRWQRVERPKFDIERYLDGKGRLIAHTFPGAYPLAYLDWDGCVICPDCATDDYRESLDDVDGVDWVQPTDVFIHYEFCPHICESCNAEIESAYGCDCEFCAERERV